MDIPRELLYYRRMESLAPLPFASLRISAPPNIYKCEREWRWAPPPLTDHDFWFVVSGTGELERGGLARSVSAGSCVLLAPGEKPRGRQNPDDRLTVFFVHFEPLDADGNVGSPLVVSEQPEVRDMLAFVTSAHRIVRLWQRGDPVARHQAQLLLGVLVWQIWDETRFPVSPASEVFDTLGAAIRREPGRHWTLEEMAGRTSLSRAQFARRFREIFGTSPMGFVIQSRLERASHLLAETEMTLAQISIALGYCDVYFFARQFRKFTGKTPGSLRNRR